MSLVKEELQTLSNNELLDLMVLFVKVEHYDPYKTPQQYLDWYNKGVTSSVVREEVTKRMEG